LNLLMTNRIEL